LGLCEPDWIRTNDLLLRRQLLYPAELPVLIRVAQNKEKMAIISKEINQVWLKLDLLPCF